MKFLPRPGRGVKERTAEKFPPRRPMTSGAHPGGLFQGPPAANERGHGHSFRRFFPLILEVGQSEPVDLEGVDLEALHGLADAHNRLVVVQVDHRALLVDEELHVLVDLLALVAVLEAAQ